MQLQQYLNWRALSVLVAIFIVAISVWFINNLSKDLAAEETRRIIHYGLALENLTKNQDANCDMNLAGAMINDNANIPVILTDAQDNILDGINTNTSDKQKLRELKNSFAKLHTPIVVEIEPKQFVYYGQSKILQALNFFPIVLFGIISIFLAVVFIAYNSTNRAIQNKVWVGLSKETAHQLGTPLMSLLAWVEHLRAKGDTDIADEMQKDVDRLQLVAERFSKIGGIPQLQVENVTTRILSVVDYMQKRSPNNVRIIVSDTSVEAPILLNGPLFDWVLENLIRNSLDALEGKGLIEISIQNLPVEVLILVRDTGKGMNKATAEKIFKPGFTTKARGWGLGLSLAKRIIRTYHHGTIEVAKTELGKGTTFKIVLRR
jgi:two-component sensor histidine kinase